MSVYNIISKNTITSPFIQFTKEQDIITSQINNIFHSYLSSNINNKLVSQNIKKIKPLIIILTSSLKNFLKISLQLSLKTKAKYLSKSFLIIIFNN